MMPKVVCSHDLFTALNIKVIEFTFFTAYSKAGLEYGDDRFIIYFYPNKSEKIVLLEKAWNIRLIYPKTVSASLRGIKNYGKNQKRYLYIILNMAFINQKVERWNIANLIVGDKSASQIYFISCFYSIVLLSTSDYRWRWIDYRVKV